jgi:hypothetical protein
MNIVGSIWSGLAVTWRGVGLERTTPDYFLTLERENGDVPCIMEGDDS